MVVMSHYSQPLRHGCFGFASEDVESSGERKKMRSMHMICKEVSVRITTRLECSERRTCAVMPQRMQVIAWRNIVSAPFTHELASTSKGRPFLSGSEASWNWRSAAASRQCVVVACCSLDKGQSRWADTCS